MTSESSLAGEANKTAVVDSGALMMEKGVQIPGSRLHISPAVGGLSTCPSATNYSRARRPRSYLRDLSAWFVRHNITVLLKIFLRVIIKGMASLTVFTSEPVVHFP